jgi:hypothetical protein
LVVVDLVVLVQQIIMLPVAVVVPVHIEQIQ